MAWKTISFRRGEPKAPVFTVGFYNLENLFDTRNDPTTLDDEFTPKGLKHWNPQRYQNKLGKLARTITRLGNGSSNPLPVLLGVAELENRGVLEDLLQTRWLNGRGMRYIHHDSPDERGIDTALVYNSDHFRPEKQEAIPLLVYEPDGTRDYTRDIIHVEGLLNGERVHVFVNHWPSRRDGDQSTAQKRMVAAETLTGRIRELEARQPGRNYIVMGDFNDGPGSESMQHLTTASDLHNPLEKRLTGQRGSAKYREGWLLFDQILLSKTFLTPKPGTHSLDRADIFDPVFLQEWKLPFRGKPFRTFLGRKYLGGYSDHFPVYIRLRYEP